MLTIEMNSFILFLSSLFTEFVIGSPKLTVEHIHIQQIFSLCRQRRRHDVSRHIGHRIYHVGK